MSRVFKDKPAKKAGEAVTKSTSTSKTPVDSKPQAQTDQGVTLVAATPVKAQRRAQLQPTGLSTSTRISWSPTPDRATSEIEEEDWSLPSPPDVLLLGVGGGDTDGKLGRRPFGTAGHILAGDTPVKKGRRGLN
jgi:hypothetical protein